MLQLYIVTTLTVAFIIFASEAHTLWVFINVQHTFSNSFENLTALNLTVEAIKLHFEQPSYTECISLDTC